MKKLVNYLLLMMLVVSTITITICGALFYVPNFDEKESSPTPTEPEQNTSTSTKLPLNQNIDVGSEIYVQHDDENNDKFILTSEGETTICYKYIFAKYTAGKQWTKDGLYIDSTDGKVGATSPEDYISVKENEVYFVRLYGIGEVYRGENGKEWHITTPIVYFDDDNNCVGNALSSTYSKSKSGVEITIPENATRMYISNYNNQNISIQKKLSLSKSEFDKIKSNQEKLLNFVETNYDDVKNDPIVYDKFDKGYVSFVIDDSRPDVDVLSNLFIENNVPLCLASVAGNLLNNGSMLKETRLETALNVQNSGGEILCHTAPVITNETIEDEEFLYNYFVVQKQLLTQMGLDVNGIILAGGIGQITGSSITAKWASAFYKYSDLLGEKQTSYGLDSVYYHSRTGLGGFNNDFEKIKTAIDDAIENKKWTVFYFHDTNEVSTETLTQIFEYLSQKRNNEIAVSTYSEMYENFAIRVSDYETIKTTYYVSSTGTGTFGTSQNSPINLETLNKKVIRSGDTILFKSGDTFFGSINFPIINIDGRVITISSYGEGELPTICSYKLVSNVWQESSDGIYRVDIKNSNNFEGYQSDDKNSFNVGFLEDKNGKKYFNKKSSIENCTEDYDFYSDGDGNLYMKLSENPYKVLGELKVVVRNNLLYLSSNMVVENLRFAYSGGHAIVGANLDEKNIKISNCIIENIGGSYLYSSNLSNETRYGNGIEFYNSNVYDVSVTENIFRNIYDVAFTIQGTSGSGQDVFVYNNVFVCNSQDSEVWESENATGVKNYRFHKNISIGQGRGWGYEARSDKYCSASILFWGYEIEETDIVFSENTFYNPRQVYYFAVATDKYLLSHSTISSNKNTFYLSEDSSLYRNNWDYDSKDEFIKKYKFDINSVFELIVPNDEITLKANSLKDIDEIRNLLK